MCGRGMHGGGHAWQGGCALALAVCVAGGVWSKGGHAWLERWPLQTGGTHPTGNA